MKFLLGIVIGGGLAMIFPEQAADAFAFFRDYINSAANYIADQTDDSPLRSYTTVID